MMVTFVSECEKKALKKTRKVLDAFANRIGGNTWQTVITQEGLDAVRKSLRNTASKNTAVSCHYLHSRSRTELAWIVGNRNKFNSQGIVPVNSTQEEGLLVGNEYRWRNVEVISLLAGIAGLFHDFGKANQLFQNKLKPKKKGKGYEPYRHEWVSLRLFQAFVITYSAKSCPDDRSWLKALSKVDNKAEAEVLKKLFKDHEQSGCKVFGNLPPVAKMVAWLIVSHHRLPIYPYDKNGKASVLPQYKYVDNWLDIFEPMWNSPQIIYDDWTEKEKNSNWFFKEGTPFKSATWQIKASALAEKALGCQCLLSQDWFNQRFTAHLSRLSLMIADHYYSSLKKPNRAWQDRNYQCYANTDDLKRPKQKLDEHNIGVGKNAKEFANNLPQLKNSLPTLRENRNKKLTASVSEKDKELFGWQDNSFKYASTLRKETKEKGFFGINMASTGRGKTVANARIMYALTDEKESCRFSIALGLRTLTLQTGAALANILDLNEEDYAVLIGSQAVKKIYESNKEKRQQDEEKSFDSTNGSESSEDNFSKENEVFYAGVPNNRILSKWLDDSPKLQKLIDAPLLITTIDHLIPATEGVRGGRQIAPMLRLLTSDLVLDEPDDFGLEDLPALCRLVNWTAMLGGKVLLSTATMPPAFSVALFQAYQAGWKDYTKVNGAKGATSSICCAWFDEFNIKHETVDDKKEYPQQHNQFVKKRIDALAKEIKVLRKADFLPVSCSKKTDATQAMAKVISTAIQRLHKDHHQLHVSGKKVSIGLVRMANINPLVAVAKLLFASKPESDYRLHYCIYHGHYPLAIRSHIEEKLDTALKRDNEKNIWLQDEIKHAIENQPEMNHVFIVVATSVAEVGRDHDYDWAIAEPSSMRSLIQLAGRIQRHRKKEPSTSNLLILTQNIKALQGEQPAYCRPGFETKGDGEGKNKRMLTSSLLPDVLGVEHLEKLDSTSRIAFKGKLKDCPKRRNGEYSDFVEMEHWALYQRLLGFDDEKEKASYWWENNATWCAEQQRRQPFRRSIPDEAYALCVKNDELVWSIKDQTGKKVIYEQADNIYSVPLDIVDGNQAWMSIDEKVIYQYFADLFNKTVQETSEQLGELRLRESNDEWHYNQFLGVFNEI